jgi:HEAT repeat protein
MERKELLMTLASIVISLFPVFASVHAQETPAQKDALGAARSELAEIRVLVGAQRDYRGAEKRLATLLERLAASTDPGAAELRAEVETLAREVRRALGLWNDGSAGDDKVDQAVREALAARDLAFVKAMGKRAAPALQEAVRKSPDSYPGDPAEDPLALLVEIDPLAASAVIGELVEHESYFWMRRVMTRVLVQPLLPGEDELWAAGNPQRWLGTGLTRMAERYVDDREGALFALRFLVGLAARGERSERLEPALQDALRSPDSALRKGTQELAFQYARPLGAPLFETLLQDADGEARAFAARVLVEQLGSRAVLSAVEDPAWEVRRQVARWLEGNGSDAWGDEGFRALETLLLDANERVRNAAFEALVDLPKEERVFEATIEGVRTFKGKTWVYSRPLAPEFYRSLLGLGFDGRLADVALATPVPACFELCEALAGSSDGEVVAHLAQRVFLLPYWEDPAATLRIVNALRANPVLGGRERTKLEEELAKLAAPPGGLPALVAWVLAHPGEGLEERLHQPLGRNPFDPRELARLDAELAFAFLRRLHPIDRDAVRVFFLRGREGFPAWTAEQSRAARALVADAAQPLGLRLVALHGLVNDGELDADLVALAQGLLLDPAWNAGPAWERETLVGLLERDLGGATNALILAALRSPDLPDSVVSDAAACVAPAHAGAAEVLRAVVERGFGRESWENTVRAMLWAMRDAPPLADRALLARAIGDERLRRTALTVIGELRDPSLLPLVSQVLAEPVPAYQIRWAAEALFGFLDAEAFEPLLAAAAKVQDAEVRDRCLAHLEKIREYQEARDRWAAREASRQTRERVIGELLGQLDARSDEVRVQAIRALVTWQALEALPRLIELTTASSKTVAAAAREALERLNAPAKDGLDRVRR